MAKIIEEALPRQDQLTLTGGFLSSSRSSKRSNAPTSIPMVTNPRRIGEMPNPPDGGGRGAASANGGGGGASTTGRTHPPAGVCAVAAALAAIVAEEPQRAAAEACDPKMLSATIGLIV